MTLINPILIDSSKGNCGPFTSLFKCYDTTDPTTNRHLILRGNEKRVMYLPWMECIDTDYGATDSFGDTC